jgi:hypothetical protein
MRKNMIEFKMPPITDHDVDVLIQAALDRACYALGADAKQKYDTYAAWVNYARTVNPNRRCHFMLDDETHHGAAWPYFVQGDKWHHDGVSWTIIKANGNVLRTRDQKVKNDK